MAPTTIRRAEARARMARLVRASVLLAGYAAVVVWLTWPLAEHAHTHISNASVAAEFDSLYSAWVLSHESRALAEAPSRLADGKIYHPTAAAVFYGPSALGALPYFAPVYALSGNPALAINVVLVLCTALTAVGLHLVIHAWTGDHAAGAIAAFAFLTCRWVLFGFVAVTPHLSVLQYFPWIVFLAAGPVAGARRWLSLLVLVVLQCLTDLVYVALAVLAPLAAIAIARVLRRESRRDGVRLILLLAMALVVLSPVVLSYANVRRAIPDIRQNTVWEAMELPLEITNLFSKTVLLTGRPTTVAPAAVALAAIGGVVALLRRARRRRAESGVRASRNDDAQSKGWGPALLWVAVGTLISLPPTLAWNRRTFTSPLGLLAGWTPLYEVIRAPSRLGVAALFGLCLLAGLGFAELTRALRSRTRSAPVPRAASAVLAAASMWLMYALPPRGGQPFPARYPLLAVPQLPPSFERFLRAGSEPLLHLPALSRTSRWPVPAWHARAMYLSISHGRPLLNGYSSYWPPGFIERMELAERLPDATALAELVRETGVALVWVHLGDMTMTSRARWFPSDDLARISDLRLLAHEGPNLLFLVRGRRPAHAAKAGLP
jgi:hypothetical protein